VFGLLMIVERGHCEHSRVGIDVKQRLRFFMLTTCLGSGKPGHCGDSCGPVLRLVSLPRPASDRYRAEAQRWQKNYA
jgi:hypothetical protein